MQDENLIRTCFDMSVQNREEIQQIKSESRRMADIGINKSTTLETRIYLIEKKLNDVVEELRDFKENFRSYLFIEEEKDN